MLLCVLTLARCGGGSEDGAASNDPDEFALAEPNYDDEAPFVSVAPRCQNEMDGIHLTSRGTVSTYELYNSLQYCRRSDWLAAAEASRSPYATLEDYSYYWPDSDAILLSGDSADRALENWCASVTDDIASGDPYLLITAADLLACNG